MFIFWIVWPEEDEKKGDKDEQDSDGDEEGKDDQAPKSKDLKQVRQPTLLAFVFITKR